MLHLLDQLLLLEDLLVDLLGLLHSQVAEEVHCSCVLVWRRLNGLLVRRRRVCPLGRRALFAAVKLRWDSLPQELICLLFFRLSLLSLGSVHHGDLGLGLGFGCLLGTSFLRLGFLGIGDRLILRLLIGLS